MSKNKSVFVTALFAVMLGCLDFCLWKINLVGFVLLTGALALYGYYEAARTFAAWLAEKNEPELDPPSIANLATVDLLPEDFSATVEEIMKEVQDEAGA
ncbi:MAG: hypothetical protein J6Y20_08755 [Lachnospiraceae bacterium]|nr:hypothetical protein [Lachnospiraceae bacterium]